VICAGTFGFTDQPEVNEHDEFHAEQAAADLEVQPLSNQLDVSGGNLLQPAEQLPVDQDDEIFHVDQATADLAVQMCVDVQSIGSQLAVNHSAAGSAPEGYIQTQEQRELLDEQLQCESCDDVTSPEHSYSKLLCPSTSFSQKLLVPPQPERSSRKIRAKPPSYNLTGNEHMTFVSDKLAAKDAKNKQASKQKDTAANVAESAVTKKPKQVKQLKKAVGRVETENKKPRKNAAAVMRSSEVTAKKTTSKPRRKKDQTANSAAEVSELNSADGYPCTLCGIVYGAHDDPKKSEEWWPCKNCGREFHESCAQTTGVLDDDDHFICIKCL